jgi:DUF1680 family protein
MLPTWTYVTGEKSMYVNLYIGSTINVERVAGTDVQMIQKTEYPWKGYVSITVNPKVSKEFAVYVRVPNRTTSELYKPDKEVNGLKWLKVNGKLVKMQVEKGYAVIKRTWKKGDKIELEMPMEVQKFTADERIVANKGRVALRYGPIVYNVEKVDKQDIDQAISKAPMTVEWNKDLLRGVMIIKGTWADGTPLTAIPNYVRNNRITKPVTTALAPTTTPTQAAEPPQRLDRTPSSIIWIKATDK